jgi:hypothetical protein
MCRMKMATAPSRMPLCLGHVRPSTSDPRAPAPCAEHQEISLNAGQANVLPRPMAIPLVNVKSKTMIDVYSWPTPNGHKVHILLEEIGCDYTVIPINIRKGDQFTPEFKAISPNCKIPAIVDRHGRGGTPISIFESARSSCILLRRAASSCRNSCASATASSSG